MASKGGGERISSALIEQFCAVTGASEDVGQAMLEACGGNLEMAIGMHMDEGGDPTGQAAAVPVQEDGDSVRAPIPQKTEQLIEEAPVFGFRGRRRQAKSVFDGFRDFQAEARQQALGESSSNSGGKRKTLEDLFRPPIQLMHKGSFNSAREKGAADNRWLMINIQNVQEFSCQALNRDVWSNHSVKCLIQRHFIFWQVYHDSEEGKKYTQFYKVFEWPYVAVLDPRTGENMVVWNKIDSATFCDIVSDFLQFHPSPDGSSATCTLSCSPPVKKMKLSDSIVDANEDSQLLAAIQASMTSSNTASSSSTGIKHSADDYLLRNSDSGDNDSDDLETFTDSDCSTDLSQYVSHVKKSKKPDNKRDTKPLTPVVKSCPISESNSQLEADEDSDQGTDDNSSESEDLSKEQDTDDTEVSATNEQSEKTKSSTNVKSSASNNLDSWKDHLGSENDKKSNLMLRFPDGRRQQLSIPSSSKLLALTLYVAEEGYPCEKYELVTNFPKRKLSYLDDQQTLSDTGLVQEAIFIQERG